jgi:hypothetical protein
MAKGGLAKQRFQEKQQRNRIVAQLNQLKGAGYTTEQIRNAGNDAWEELGGATLGQPQVTVKDGDTIETIAEATGGSPVDILAANPELKYVRTGMVLNTPSAPRDNRFAMKNEQSVGGLPSNAALGGTTTNPGGLSATTSGSAGTVNYQQNFMNTQRSGFGVPLTNATANQPRSLFSGGGSQYVPGGLSQSQRAGVPINPSTPRSTTPLALSSAGSAGTPPTYSGTYVRGTDGLPMTYPNGFQRWAREEMAQINSPTYTPNSMAIAVLERAGFIRKTSPTSGFGGSGGGGYGRRGGRGGGGGGGGFASAPRLGSGKASQPERLPAFASGGGFRGLVNWRI